MADFMLPPGIFVFLLVLSAFWFLIKKRWSAGILFFVIGGLLWAFSISPVSNALLRGLESGLKLPRDPSGDVIVLLGGGIYEKVPDMSGTGAPSEAMDERIISAVRLQKKLDVPVIVSGGIVYEGMQAEAPIVRRFLIDLGVPAGKIIIEDKSRDTIENARYSGRICEKRGFRNPILVTSAFHMKRSVMSFEKAGVKALPFPAGFRTWERKKYRWDEYLPSIGSLEGTAVAMHEYLGLLFYKIAY
ncbi:MAG TPA: YdcF family protein [Dissulfurispiraceae bacterium]